MSAAWKQVFGIALVAIAVFVCGCEPVKKDLKKAKQDVKDTRKNTLGTLKKLQQRGSVDLEVQQSFNAVYDAYAAFSKKEGRPPKGWNEVLKVAKQAGWVQEAKRRGLSMAWNVPIKGYLRANAGDHLLFFDEQATVTSGWAMQVDGSIISVNSRELDSKKIATQEIPATTDETKGKK